MSDPFTKLQQLLISLENQEVSAEEFRVLMNQAQKALDLDDHQCAKLFDVSQPSVTRWKEGKTTPRSLVRNHCISVLLTEVEKAMENKTSRSDRKWRTLVRITEVGSDTFKVEVPAFGADQVEISFEEIPYALCELVKKGQKYFHAKVNIGTSSAEDLRFDEWEMK